MDGLQMGLGLERDRPGLAVEGLVTEREVVADAIEAAHAVADIGERADMDTRLEALVRQADTERRLRPVLERAGATPDRPMCFAHPERPELGGIFWLNGDGDVRSRACQGSP